jgi:FixJ family two-component response regulator
MQKAKPTVFIVDDDPSVRRALKRLICSADFDARVFSSAIEFFELKLPKTPSCLVLDVQMPNLSALLKKLTFPYLKDSSRI